MSDKRTGSELTLRPGVALLGEDLLLPAAGRQLTRR